MSTDSEPLGRGSGDGTPAAAPFEARELLDAMGHAVIATDLDGTIVSWNRAAERMYGWTADEVIGRPIADVTVPEISQDAAAQIMASLRAGGSWSGGFPVRRRDGTVFHALVTDTVLLRDGEPVGMIGTSNDLDAALRMLLERSADVAMLLSSNGDVTYLSPAATSLFGWQPNDLVGTPFSDLLHPEDRPKFARDVERDGSHVLDMRVRAFDAWVWTEILVNRMVDQPQMGAIVCNLHYSERMIQLHEQKRINELLHADVLQALYAIGLNLATAEHTSPPQLRNRIEAAKRDIGAVQAKLRAVTKTSGTSQPSVRGSASLGDGPDATIGQAPPPRSITRPS